MKVLISLSYYHPHISGLSEYARSLAESLARSENSVEIACCKQDTSLSNEEMIGDVRVRRFEPTIKLRKGVFSVDLIKWAASNLSKFDLLIINLPFPEAAALSLLAIVAKVKIVSVFHCDLNLGNGPVDKILEKINVVANHLVLQRSRFVVVNSLDYSNSINQLKRYTGKIREIMPLVKLNNQKTTSKPKSNKSFYIGFLGRISKEKNLETLIHAVEICGDKTVKLVIAGPANAIGEDDYTKIILERIGQLGHRAEIWGQVDERQKQQFFRYINVLALPSDNSTESFGMVQVEAMAAGVPVITTNRPGIRDLVMETGAGLIVNQPRNVTEWKEKIYSSKKIFSKLSKNTDKIKKYYDFNEMVNKWMVLINS